MRHRARLALLMMIPLAAACGCRSSQGGLGDDYMTVAADPRRDTEAARRHNARAVGLIGDEKLDDAERELKAAMGADLFFGPAHNNLGNVYYRTRRYYLAAWEFQYAAKLMPEAVEPRNNLGLVFEAVGRLDDAARWYDTALELSPGSVEAAANLARVRVRQGQKDDATRDLLSRVVMRDPRPEWTAWARQQLALIGGPAATGIGARDNAEPVTPNSPQP